MRNEIGPIIPPNSLYGCLLPFIFAMIVIILLATCGCSGPNNRKVQAFIGKSETVKILSIHEGLGASNYTIIENENGERASVFIVGNKLAIVGDTWKVTPCSNGERMGIILIELIKR